jgi:hypothetical protein
MCPVYVHLAAIRCIDPRRNNDDSAQLRDTATMSG